MIERQVINKRIHYRTTESAEWDRQLCGRRDGQDHHGQCRGDTTIESDEAFTVTLSAPSAVVHSLASSAALVISDRLPVTGPRQTLVHCGLLGQIGLYR